MILLSFVLLLYKATRRISFKTTFSTLFLLLHLLTYILKYILEKKYILFIMHSKTCVNVLYIQWNNKYYFCEFQNSVALFFSIYKRSMLLNNINIKHIVKKELYREVIVCISFILINNLSMTCNLLVKCKYIYTIV